MSPAVPQASVIVRANNSSATIRATLEGLLAQTIRPEIIVVDSGSTDDTPHIAARYADHLVHVPSATFNYGRSLNVGAARASAPVHFALSSHVTPPSTEWIAGHLRFYRDPSVAAVNGEERLPSGQELTGVYRQTQQDAVSHPIWGFSNTAASWRAQVWCDAPFREDLITCEDKEWSWRVLAAGHAIVYDRSLWVSGAHRRAQGLRRNWSRVYREGAGMAALGASTYPDLASAAHAWWNDFSYPSKSSTWLRRISPHRAVEHFGMWAGERSVRRAPPTAPRPASRI